MFFVLFILNWFRNEPSTSSSNETQGMVAVTVLPEPRRLFGFGPQYQPPAETVLVPVDQSKSFTTGSRSLVDKVNRAGITAVDGPGGSPSKPRFGRGLLSGTTKEEINTWAPFSTWWWLDGWVTVLARSLIWTNLKGFQLYFIYTVSY